MLINALVDGDIEATGMSGALRQEIRFLRHRHLITDQNEVVAKASGDVLYRDVRFRKGEIVCRLLECRIGRWQERQWQTGEWINFARIADWCARESRSIRVDNLLAAEAYLKLEEALARGEFEEGGRSRVRYPEGLYPPATPRTSRLTREMYEACADPKPRVDVLECCWIPRDLCRRWFNALRLDPPPWLVPATSDRVGPRESTSSGSRDAGAEEGAQQAVTSPRRASHAEIDGMIAAVYDHADQHKMKPPNINQISGPVQRLLMRHGLEATRTRIQKAASAEAHAHRRRPLGQRVTAAFYLSQIPKCRNLVSKAGCVQISAGPRRVLSAETDDDVDDRYRDARHERRRRSA